VKHGSLFSGIGGFDLASEWMGWENVFHCEWNEFGQKVLKYYWPKAISYNDITKTDFTIHRGQIDILTGGFPCQPYSAAGKRLGKEDERHLWPEMLRAIREIQPTWVVGENVLGLVNWNGGLVFHEVQTDLEAEGYEVQPYVLSAVSVNAPHRRDRVFFVAYSKLYANGLRTERGMDLGGQLLERPKRKEKTNGLNNISKNERVTPNTNSNRNTQETRSDSGIERQESPIDEQGVRGQQQTGGDIGHDGLLRDASDTTIKGLERSAREGLQRRIGRSSDQTNEPNASDTDGIGLRRESDRTGESRFFSKDGKGNNWSNFPTQSPIRMRDDGISTKLSKFVVNEFYDTDSNTSKKNRIENLSEVWERISQKEIWEQIRGFYSLESKEILLQTMQLYSGEWIKQRELSPFSENVCEPIMQNLRKYGQFRCSPQGQELEKQRHKQFGDSMSFLPHEVALAAGRFKASISKFENWHRNESIKAGGNAVVPQVVHQIFKAIQEYDQRTDKG